jgi:CRP-like cAMP-binding protein
MAITAGSRTQAVAVLRKLPVFTGLVDTEYSRIFGVCKSTFIHPDDVLFREGDNGSSLYILLSGEIEISIEGRGVVHVMKAGEVLGEIGLVCRHDRTGSAIARKHCMLLELDAETLHNLLGRNPRIGYVIMKNIATTLAERLTEENKKH